MTTRLGEAGSQGRGNALTAANWSRTPSAYRAGAALKGEGSHLRTSHMLTAPEQGPGNSLPNAPCSEPLARPLLEMAQPQGQGACAPGERGSSGSSKEAGVPALASCPGHKVQLPSPHTRLLSRKGRWMEPCLGGILKGHFIASLNAKPPPETHRQEDADREQWLFTNVKRDQQRHLLSLVTNTAEPSTDPTEPRWLREPGESRPAPPGRGCPPFK